MNPSLKDFFNEEKKRVFTPDPYFHTRMMARLRGTQFSRNIWDVIPASTRPVFGLALMLLLAFVALEVFVPQIPERGFVTAIFESEQTAAEAFLFSGDDVADQELLNQLLVPEER